MKVGELELHTWVAPIFFKRSTCSSLRTMFTRATRSLMQILLSICPRLDAAAVCTSALWPSRRMVSTMPSAVRGLTKQSAPSAGVVPGGKTRHCAALMQRYCAYIAPPRMATVLPMSACAPETSRPGRRPPRLHCRRAALAPGARPAPSSPRARRWPSHGIGGRARHPGRAHVGAGEQQALVGRIDRRGVDANDDLVGFRLRRGDVDDRDLDDALFLHRRANLGSRASAGV